MRSPSEQRTIIVGGRKTSITLEEAFFQAVIDKAAGEQYSPSELYGRIEVSKGPYNLSSAIRVFVLNYYASQQG